MSLDYEKQEKRKTQISHDLSILLKQFGVPDAENDKATSLLLNNYVDITPPEKEEVFMHYITASSFSGRGGGRSVKAGNIRLNIGKLLEAVSSGVFTIVSVNTSPWAIPFAAILLWRSLWKTVEIDITEIEVVVLINLHRLKNNKKIVEKSLEEILAEVNKTVGKYERPNISKSDLSNALKQLESIDSIDKNNDGWFIREWVKISYK